MTDREMLEKAAKAAGLVPVVLVSPGHIFREAGADDSQGFHWNPLTDDGDALRLAVRLKLSIRLYESEAGAHECYEEFGHDPAAATRRAIVRAAAAIGESMP